MTKKTPADRLFWLASPIGVHAVLWVSLAMIPLQEGSGRLNPLALTIYGVAIAIAGLVLFVYRGRISEESEPSIVTLTAPIVTLFFAFALFMTKWLGNAKFAPYGSLDTEIVAFVCYASALFIVVVGWIMNRPQAIAHFGLLNGSLYLLMYGLPHAYIFPNCRDCWLGPQPHILVVTMSIYLVGYLLRYFLGKPTTMGRPARIDLLSSLFSIVILLWLWSMFPPLGEVWNQ